MKETLIVTIDRKKIEITNPGKILYPRDGITKMQVVDYYERIAPYMVPHMKKRPISMQRFPNGIDQEGFFQKDAGTYFPTWITTEAIKKENGEDVHYVVCNNAATLVYLAGQGCLVPHVWLSKVGNLNYPDRLIFDLDPSGNNFEWVLTGAKILKNLLEHLELHPFVMTTGSRGLHVVTPLKPVHDYDSVRKFASMIAQMMAEEDPKRFTVEVRKNKRKGRVFIDYLRNGFGATGVAPYSLRARDGAPIATPLDWSELKKGLSSQRYTMNNIFKRIARRGDPWEQIDKFARKLPEL